MMHKYAVVGRGLIGSAAARHLAEETGGVVCIGPDEPKNRATHESVFGSHYDEGRMTRHVDPMAEWAITAAEAIKRYRDIEERSGIPFYNPAGYLGLGFPTSTYNARCAATGAALGAEIQQLDTAEVRRRYPFLNVEDGVDGLVETGGADYISPRNMVRAQSNLAEKAGATLIHQAARAVRPVSGGVEIELWNGSVERVEKVLITAGAFTQACGLSPIDLGAVVFGRTTVLAKIEGEAERDLRKMPTMIDTSLGAYILPPIRYPDGHLYLKLGVGDASDPRFTNLDGLRGWFQSKGSPENRELFTARMRALFPILETCSEWHTDTCAVTYKQSLLPVIDFIHEDKIAVAVVGCGKGAKGTDE